MSDVSAVAAGCPQAAGTFLDRALRKLIWRRLEELAEGRLVLEEVGRRREFGRPGAHELAARIEVRDPRFYRHLAFGGSLGAAEAYLRGYWTCDNLVDLVRIFCRNAAASASLESGPARALNAAAAVAHRLRRNTLPGSRRNIAAHYDLGNEFFALFLDETMAHSCGIFPRAESSLAEASLAKFDRICRKLALNAGDHVLEIGCGWGGFALHAARHFGCRVTAATISRKQYEYAREKVANAGLENRVSIVCEDYRALQGSYDKLVSVEMIEAVGHQYFDAYFRACAQRLKPEGLMLLQAIVIPDQRYDRYRRSADFIQRYIFPGGCLPSLGAICGSVGRATDFRLVHLEDLTPHYAHTLAAWRQRLQGNLERARALGLSEEFLRTWDFYFCYCEGGFRERLIGDVQILLAKPGCRQPAILPPLSA